MKKFIPCLSLIMAAGILTGCDNVKEPERFIPVERQEAKRVVLIEEFTGQLCTNCPDGHQAIHQLLEAYPTEIVAVSINPGSSSLALSEAQGGFGTALGDEYFRNAGNPPMPSAVIDRKTSALTVENWAATAVRFMAVDTPLTLDCSAVLADDGANMNITVDMSSIDNLSGKLQVWVLESDLVGLQLDHGNYIFDYVHNHVLRAAVNGTWGEDVNLEMNEPLTVNYTQPMQQAWNADHISIVAFVYNNSGVVQAVQCDLQK